MKTAAAGSLIQEGVCSAGECRRFVWSLPVSLAVVGMETPEQVRQNARFAREFEAMQSDEMSALLERIRPRADLGLESYKQA